MLAALLNVFKVSARRAGRPVRSMPIRASDSSTTIHAEQHVAKGNLLLKSGRLDEAADCYRNAIVAMPGLGDAHLNLGFVLLEQGRVDQAVLPLKRAIEISPTSPDAHYLLGTLYARMGNVG